MNKHDKSYSVKIPLVQWDVQNSPVKTFLLWRKLFVFPVIVIVKGWNDLLMK